MIKSERTRGFIPRVTHARRITGPDFDTLKPRYSLLIRNPSLLRYVEHTPEHGTLQNDELLPVCPRGGGEGSPGKYVAHAIP
jgi:hypothetical protein